MSDDPTVSVAARFHGELRVPSPIAMGTSAIWTCDHDHLDAAGAFKCAENERSRRNSPSRRTIRLPGIHFDILLERTADNKVRMTVCQDEPLQGDDYPPYADPLLTLDGVRNLVEALQEIAQA